MSPKAKKVEYESPYKIIVTFNNEEVKMFDLMPYLNYPIYEALKDESFCSNAKVQNGVIAWNNEIDLDPDRLYFESKNISLAS